MDTKVFKYFEAECTEGRVFTIKDLIQKGLEIVEGLGLQGFSASLPCICQDGREAGMLVQAWNKHFPKISLGIERFMATGHVA